jgi:hypothetical protein
VGYYPDMSSQAAAQGYFADMVRQAISSAPILQRTTGVPFYFDLGNVVVPNAGNTPVAPTLGGRGLVAVFATWNFGGGALPNSPRVTLSGGTFTIFNDNASAANCFWIAFAA